MTRLNDWFGRVHFPAVSKAPLGFGYEYWILEPSRYEGHTELKAKASALGYQWTKRQLAHAFVERLLDDVIAAAGGVEHAIIAMRAAIAEAQAWSDQHVTTRDPSIPHSIGHISITEAWFEFANVLSWARAVEERLDRRSFAKKGTPQLPRQGLVNAVKPVRLKKRLDADLTDFRSGPLSETRLLANFTLHAALLRNPQSGARLTAAGKVYMPIPAKPVSAIFHVDILDWKNQRDAAEFAESLWCSVEKFVDRMLEAFEKAVPKRFRA